LDEGEPIAPRRGALLAADDDAGEFEAGRAVRRQTRRQFGEADDAGALEALAVGVERMARQIEADRRELVLQPLDRWPIGHQRQGRARCKARIELAEEALLPALALLGREARVAQKLLGRGKSLRPVRVQAVERAGLGEVLELPPVEALGIEAAGEIDQVLEAAMVGALGDELAHRLPAHPLDRGERVANRRLAPTLPSPAGGGGKGG